MKDRSITLLLQSYLTKMNVIISNILGYYQLQIKKKAKIYNKAVILEK